MQEALIFGLIAFFLIFLIYYFLILKRRYNNYFNKVKKKKKKNKDIYESMEISYLIYKFKLDTKKIDLLYLLKRIAIIDAFIISFTGTLVYYIPLKIMWRFLIAFALLFCLIYAIYELFGRFLVKKGWQKDEYERNRRKVD